MLNRGIEHDRILIVTIEEAKLIKIVFIQQTILYGKVIIVM